MARSSPRLERARRWWVGLRLPLAALLLGLPWLRGGLVTTGLELLPYPHGLVKAGLQTWHVLLLRIGLLPALAALALLLGLGAASLPARARRWAGPALALAALALPGASWVAKLVLAGLLLLNLAPWNDGGIVRRALRALGWLPGSGFLLPGPVLGELSGRSRLGLALAPLVLLPLWFGADHFLAREIYLPGLIDWPDERVDPRVTVLERAAVMRGEYHDIELLDGHAVVVAEDSCRLLAVPRDGGETLVRELAPRWPPFHAGALDAWVSPAGLTWVLTAPNELSGLRLGSGGWATVVTRYFPGPCNFAYLVPAPEIDRLLMVFVNAHDREPGGLVPFALPEVNALERVKFERPDGAWFPAPRDVAWVPPLGQLVLSPNFGDRLYLADPESGVVEPWLELYSANAKPLWVPGLERLLVARPDAPELAVVEPLSGTVERNIPVQRGVRAVAVDPGRGLLLTGSVLTGEVELRRLQDGALLDSFGTLMPMIREIELDVERGEAIVATWTVLYRLSYAPPR